MNDNGDKYQDVIAMKEAIEEKYHRKNFGKFRFRIPKKPLTKVEKKAKRKMTQASRRKNRG